MSIPFRWFKKELEDQGFSLKQTSNGHYWVMTPKGGKLIVFAVTHGSGSKGNEVFKSYVTKVRKAVKSYLESSQ